MPPVYLPDTGSPSFSSKYKPQIQSVWLFKLGLNTRENDSQVTAESKSAFAPLPRAHVSVMHERANGRLPVAADRGEINVDYVKDCVLRR